MTLTKADTFIRVGASGSYQAEVEVGHLVITSGVVRTEGLTKDYVSSEYPAVSSYEVVMALVEAAEKLDHPYHVGITRSDDSIYMGSGVPVRDYLQEEHTAIRDYWIKTNVLNVERETSTIITLSNLFGFRGGAVLRIGRNMITGIGEKKYPYSIDRAILTGLEGAKILSQMDEDKERAGKKWWFPSI
jgi:uridine phosphorylase